MTSFCPCNSITIETTGGLTAGGSASILGDTREGGIVCGGTASVAVPSQPADGMAAWYPLFEQGTGEIDEYQDLTPYQLHGIGGSGDAEFCPTQDAGVFCLNCQLFDTGRQFINLPRDLISADQPFSCSFWVRVESTFSERTFYSRGFETNGLDWLFSIGTSFLNHVMVYLNVVTDDGPETVLAFSTSFQLETNRFYHIGCSWTPADAVRIYVNGELEGITNTPELSTVEYVDGNHGQVGRRSLGQGMLGNIQELRVWPEVRSAAQFEAEFWAFCDPSFVQVGEIEDAVMF